MNNSFDRKRYMSVIDRINDDTLARRREGRTSSIARLILEGGRTFDKGETYFVAVLFPNEQRAQWLWRAIVDLFQEEDFMFHYNEAQTRQGMLYILDHFKRVKIAIAISTYRRHHDAIMGIKLDNYFIDVTEEDLFPEMPRVLHWTRYRLDPSWAPSRLPVPKIDL